MALNYIAIIVTIGVLLVTLIYLFPPVRVEGESMMPTYKDGEIVLSTRFFKVREGDVCVYQSPTGEVVIKRLIYRKGKTLLYFMGDNRDFSLDSRYYGYINEPCVISKVLFCRKREDKNVE